MSMKKYEASPFLFESISKISIVALFTSCASKHIKYQVPILIILLLLIGSLILSAEGLNFSIFCQKLLFDSIHKIINIFIMFFTALSTFTSLFSSLFAVFTLLSTPLSFPRFSQRLRRFFAFHVRMLTLHAFTMAV